MAYRVVILDESDGQELFSSSCCVAMVSTVSTDCHMESFCCANVEPKELTCAHLVGAYCAFEGLIEQIRSEDDDFDDLLEDCRSFCVE